MAVCDECCRLSGIWPRDAIHTLYAAINSDIERRAMRPGAAMSLSRERHQALQNGGISIAATRIMSSASYYEFYRPPLGTGVKRPAARYALTGWQLSGAAPIAGRRLFTGRRRHRRR